MSKNANGTIATVSQNARSQSYITSVLKFLFLKVAVPARVVVKFYVLIVFNVKDRGR